MQQNFISKKRFADGLVNTATGRSYAHMVATTALQKKRYMAELADQEYDDAISQLDQSDDQLCEAIGSIGQLCDSRLTQPELEALGKKITANIIKIAVTNKKRLVGRERAMRKKARLDAELSMQELREDI